MRPFDKSHSQTDGGFIKDEALGELVRTQLIELLCCDRYLRVKPLPGQGTSFVGPCVGFFHACGRHTTSHDMAFALFRGIFASRLTSWCERWAYITWH